MPHILQAGNGQSQNHRATIVLIPHLIPGFPPGNYKFFVSTTGSVRGPSGAHIFGINLGAGGDITGFEVWTDEEVSQFSWMVVE